MGLFSLTQEIAVDLGTANTIIIHNNKIVVDEPSYVALDSKGRLVAVGEQAKMMQGKEHSGIRTIRPLRDGVIADFNAAELMIRGPNQNGQFQTPVVLPVVANRRLHPLRKHGSGNTRRARFQRARRRPRRLHDLRAHGRRSRHRARR